MTLTERRIDVALGSSSPLIVAGWHDRDWSALAGRMEETVLALRALLDGERLDLDGNHVRTHGFRLRHPVPETSITVAAFGPAVTRVAARCADEVVLNLVAPDRVARVRRVIDVEAARAGSEPPGLAVWIPVALEPGDATRSQLAGQLAIYLAAPGYADQFAELGFGALVEAARSGLSRRELAGADPARASCCDRRHRHGSARSQIGLRSIGKQGPNTVAVVPSTAEDPGANACSTHSRESASGEGRPRDVGQTNASSGGLDPPLSSRFGRPSPRPDRRSLDADDPP